MDRRSFSTRSFMRRSVVVVPSQGSGNTIDQPSLRPSPLTPVNRDTQETCRYFAPCGPRKQVAIFGDCVWARAGAIRRLPKVTEVGDLLPIQPYHVSESAALLESTRLKRSARKVHACQGSSVPRV